MFHHTGESKSEPIPEQNSCVVHGADDVRHNTSDCKTFQVLSRSEKFEKLRNVGACFRCFGQHLRSECRASEPCDICGKTSHNSLLCMDA